MSELLEGIAAVRTKCIANGIMPKTIQISRDKYKELLKENALLTTSPATVDKPMIFGMEIEIA
jgi:hypothetical protein